MRTCASRRGRDPLPGRRGIPSLRDGRAGSSSRCPRSRAGAARRGPSRSRSSWPGRRPLPLIVEVPHDLHARLGISLAVDLIHREGLAGRVVLEAAVGTDPGLTRELLRGLLIFGRWRVVPEGGANLELHSFIEEEVAIVPELRGKEGLERVNLVEGDDVAFLE